MRYAKNDLQDLTICLNEAILELGAPLSSADGTLASATTQLNALLVWSSSTLDPANGTLADDFKTYNYWVRGEQMHLMVEANRVANHRYVSDEVTIPVGVTSVRIILTSSNWSTAAPGEVDFGAENSQDNGASWQVVGGAITPIGYLNKGWMMPTVSFWHVDEVGGLWRLYIQTTANVRAGIDGRLI